MMLSYISVGLSAFGRASHPYVTEPAGFEENLAKPIKMGEFGPSVSRTMELQSLKGQYPMRRMLMALLTAIRGGAPTAPNSKPDMADQSECKTATIMVSDQVTPHCVPSGAFSVLAVGESFYRDDIAKIAGNREGSIALVYCTATLFLDDGNPRDSQAVAVLIEGKKVGHLCRTDALRYRHGLNRTGNGHVRTTCDVVVRGGLATQSRQYDYSVELDCLLDSPLDLDHPVPVNYPRPVRLDSGLNIESRNQDEIVIRFPYVPQDLLDRCQECSPIDIWTTPDGGALHFFCQGSVGGSGRLGVILENDLAGIINEIESMNHISIYRVDGHTVYARAANTPDARLKFYEREDASVSIIDVDISHGKISAVVAMAFTAKTKNGAMLNQGATVSWEANEEKSTGEATLAQLIDLLSCSDMVVSRRDLSELRPLHALLGKPVTEGRLWRSAASMLSEPLPEPAPETLNIKISSLDLGDRSNCENACEALAAFLFRHTGKTSRSQTMLCRLMR